jgi:hypothetical protein
LRNPAVFSCPLQPLSLPQGSYYYLGEQRLGQGKEAVSTLLAQESALTQQLTQQVKAAITAAAMDGGLGSGAAAPAEGEEEESDSDLEVEALEALQA